MAVQNGIVYRQATVEDAFSLMNFYQMAAEGKDLNEPLLLNYQELLKSLRSDKMRWFIALDGEKMRAAFYLLLDPENRLVKLFRAVLDPRWEDSIRLLTDALPLLIQKLRVNMDMLYTTTRSVTMEQQEQTLNMGFKLLGIFPNAMGEDICRVNGMSAYYVEKVLTERRQATFWLHPLVVPFYEIIRKQCNLGELPVGEVPRIEMSIFERLPPLEIIHAPHFVSHRFTRLNEKKSLTVHFYPFHDPDVLISSPRQDIEIFIKIIPEIRFAAIIGERIELPVNPTELYSQVALLLNQRNIKYIEMINDAGDVVGIDCLMKAGFLPCGYVPCFKKQGDKRRDYVILARSFERFVGYSKHCNQIHPIYLEFLHEYLKLDEKYSLGTLFDGM